MDKLSVLLVDDDMDIGTFIKIKLSREAPQFSLSYSDSGEGCLEYIRNNSVDCILSDYQMPGMDGMQLLNSVRGMGYEVPFIFLTGQGNEQITREAFKNGADDYFTKDIGFAHFTRITNSIEQAVNRRKAEKERMRAESMLRESEERYRALFETAHDGIMLMEGGTILDCNQMAAGMFGCTDKSEVIGHSPVEFSPAKQPDGTDSGEKAIKYINAVLEGEPQRFYWKNLRKDGTTLDVDVSISRLVLEGRPYIQAIVRDVTENRRAEEALRTSQNFLETIIETEPECVKLISPQGKLLLMNRAGLDMIQAESLDKVRGRAVSELIAPEDREAFQKVGETVFQGNTGRLEFGMIGFKGRRLRLETHAVPLRDDDGNITALLGITRDVTERRRVEAELQQEKDKLGAILANIGEGVSIQDTEYKILYQNQAHISIIGSHVGRHCYEAYGQKDAVCDDCPVAESFKDGGVHTMRRMVETEKGVKHVEITASCVKDMSGNPLVGIELVSDITDRTSSEEALKLSEARYRSFIANSSEAIWRFELENPLDVSLPEDEQVGLIFRDAYLAECNDAVARMFGLANSSEALGARLSDMIPQSDPRNVEHVRRFIRAGYRVVKDESYPVAPGGEPFLMLCSFTGEVEDGRLMRAWGVSSVPAARG